ncbi:MAG: ABC transporter permease [Pirellulales bacterium]
MNRLPAFSRRWVRRVVPPMIVLIGVLTVWELAVRWWEVPAMVLPGPWLVGQAVVRHAQALGFATLLTATAASLGLLSSFVLGVAIAMIFSQAAVIRRSLFPYAIFLQTVPIVAIAPVIVIWLGEGLLAVVVIAAIVSLFPIITNVTEGLTSVPQSWQDLFRLNGATRWQTLWKLQVPSALPNLVIGLKVAAGAAVLGTIVGEIFAGAGARSPGLGYLIFSAKSQFKLDFLFAAVGCCTLLGIIFFSFVAWAGQRWLLNWQEPKIHDDSTDDP